MSAADYLPAIANLVPENSRVLDLGCGNGWLLHHLIEHKNCTGYGVELDDANVLACTKRSIPVLQLNLEEGLSIFDDNSFDVVLQIDTFQHLRNAKTMLLETVRIGQRGIVAFPNFAHWPNRLATLAGRMPVTKRLPYQWYNTPNIRVGTFADMTILIERLKLNIYDQFGLNAGRVIRFMPNLCAPSAVFCIAK